MLPAAVLLLLFLTYPLGLGVWLGFTDTKVGRGGEWVGLENYRAMADDPVFWRSTTPEGGSSCPTTPATACFRRSAT